MVLKADQVRVKTLLAETITLLCKNGLHFKTKFSIEGLIGITLDDEDIFLVNINETIKAAESVQENEDSDIVLEQLPLGAKRAQNKADGVENKVSSPLSENPASSTVKSLDASSSIPKIPSISHTRSLRSSCQTSPLSIAKSNKPSRVPRTVGASPGIGAFSGSNDSIAECGNDSLPASSSVGFSECESLIFPSAPLKIDRRPGDEDYDDNKTRLLTEADLPERPNKRIRLGSSDVPPESSMIASTSNETNAAFNVPKERTKSEPPDVIEIKEESLSDDDHGQQPNYSAYEDYNNAVPYGSSSTEMMQGFADSSMFQAGSSFFVPQQGEIDHNPDTDQHVGIMDRGPWTCWKCGQQFLTISTLRIHQNRVHRKQLPCVCPICGKGVHSKRDLRGHMANKHDTPKEFTCPICSKDFCYQRFLRKHLTTAHQISA